MSLTSRSLAAVITNVMLLWYSNDIIAHVWLVLDYDMLVSSYGDYLTTISD